MRRFKWLVPWVILEAASVGAQEAEKPAEMPPEIRQQQEMLIKLGLPAKQALLVSVLSSNPDLANWLPMLLGERPGQDQDEAMGLAMLQQMMAPRPTAPACVVSGDFVLIVDNGQLYKVDPKTMQVVGKVSYRQTLSPAASMALLVPVFEEARGKAQAAACGSNLKQLALGALQYGQDWDGAMPKRTWAVDIMPYVKNAEVLVCPARQQLKVGYAMNAKLVGKGEASVAMPAETVLFFESDLGGDSPVGGPIDVPEAGVHDGLVAVVFVDGHAKLVKPEEAKALLSKPIAPPKPPK